MKILTSLLIAAGFAGITFFRNEGLFDIGIVNVFSISYLGTVDLSFIDKGIDKLLFIPDLIFLFIKDWVQLILPDNYFFSDRYINMYTVAIFYFVFSFIITLTTKIFSFNRDKVYLVLLIISFYFLLLFFL